MFEERTRIYQREADDLRSLGFEPEELDLRLYFDRPDALRTKLEAYRLVWVTGGNAFVLARAMSASGFRDAARVHVDLGSLTYAGYSAGACVTARDLDGIQFMDDPAIIPPGYSAAMPPATLGWVPWRIVPHWRSDHPEAGAAERAARHLEDAGLEYRTLSDGDAIVIDHQPPH